MSLVLAASLTVESRSPQSASPSFMSLHYILSPSSTPPERFRPWFSIEIANTRRAYRATFCMSSHILPLRHERATHVVLTAGIPWGHCHYGIILSHTVMTCKPRCTCNLGATFDVRRRLQGIPFVRCRTGVVRTIERHNNSNGRSCLALW